MLVAPIVEAGSNELIGVVQIINTKSGQPFPPLAEGGRRRAVRDAGDRLPAAPEAAGYGQGKYDSLVANAVLSADELDLALRSARRKKSRHRGRADSTSSRSSCRRSARRCRAFFGVPYEPFKTDRIKPLDLLKNLKRDYVESNQWVPIDDTKDGLIVLCHDPERVRAFAHRRQRLPQAQVVYRVTDAARVQGDARPVLRRGRWRDTRQHRRPAVGHRRRRRR